MLKKDKLYKRRKLRNRYSLKLNSDKPRLNVHKTDRHIYAQVINDRESKTIVAFSTLSKDFKDKQTWNVKAAEIVGQKIGEQALKAGIKEVKFDRGAYKFHGKVKAVADGARKAGLKL